MRKFTSLLLLGFALGSFAQTPGGVSGSELWFKTAPLNSDLQGYYRWQDFSGDSIRLMLLDSRGVKSELTLPNSSVHYFNFNPRTVEEQSKAVQRQREFDQLRNEMMNTIILNKY